MAYAEGTKVPVSRSKAEVETLLRKAGATGYMAGWDESSGESRVQCMLMGRMLQFQVMRPDVECYAETASGRKRSERDQQSAVDAEERRRWRALVLIIKAKLETIDAGLDTVDEAFLANVVLPDGSTVGHMALPAIERAYETGKMPKRLLPGGR